MNFFSEKLYRLKAEFFHRCSFVGTRYEGPILPNFVPVVCSATNRIIFLALKVIVISEGCFFSTS